MKKTILFLALAFTAGNLATSCSNRDDEPTVVTPKYDVIGKWNAVEYQDKGVWKDMSMLKWYSEFGANGSYKSYSGTNYSGTYMYDNKDHVVATVGSEKVHYNIISMNATDAIAEMYYESTPTDKVTYKLKK